jgi:transcriptional regulator with XRE-family HTH domain
MPRPRRNRPPDPSRVQSMTDGLAVATVSGAPRPESGLSPSEHDDMFAIPRLDGKAAPLVISGTDSARPEGPVTLPGPEDASPSVTGTLLGSVEGEWASRMDAICADIEAMEIPPVVVDVPPEGSMLPWVVTYVNARGGEMDGPSGTEPDEPIDAGGYEDPPIACGTFTATASEMDELTRTDERLRPLGAALRAAREASGRTMGDIAQTLGVSVVWVSDVERGRVLPDVTELGRICDAIGTGRDEQNDIEDEWLRATGTPILGYAITDSTPNEDGTHSVWVRLGDAPLDADEEARASYPVTSLSPETRATIEAMQPLRPFSGHQSPEKWSSTPEERRAATVAGVLADPLAALEVYRAVATGRVRIAEWSTTGWRRGELVPVQGGEAIGRIYPTPNGGWAGRVADRIEEFDREEEARVSVATRLEGVGWTVLPPSGRKR